MPTCDLKKVALKKLLRTAGWLLLCFPPTLPCQLILSVIILTRLFDRNLILNLGELGRRLGRRLAGKKAHYLPILSPYITLGCCYTIFAKSDRQISWWAIKLRIIVFPSLQHSKSLVYGCKAQCFNICVILPQNAMWKGNIKYQHKGNINFDIIFAWSSFLEKKNIHFDNINYIKTLFDVISKCTTVLLTVSL